MTADEYKRVAARGVTTGFVVSMMGVLDQLHLQTALAGIDAGEEIVKLREAFDSLTVKIAADSILDNMRFTR